MKYEADEMRIALSLIKNGDCCLDIGANFGIYSRAIAKKYPDCVIHAFEPIPDTYRILVNNTFLLHNIYAHNVALTDSVEKATFFYNKEEPGAASMRNIRETDKAEKVTVKTQTLDISAQFLDKVDFIKCDVEGAELLVLKGGLKTIKKHKPVILMEMLRKWSAKFGYHPNDIIKLLGDIGYKCYRITSGKLRLFKKMTDRTKQTNFFFIHRK